MSTDAGSSGSVIHGGGDMGERMRAFDWTQTALGPPPQWPASLQTALSLLLDSGYPMYIAWGRDFIQLYNDAYSSILGSKHPAALGNSTYISFAEIWDIIGPMFQAVLDSGVASTYTDQLLPLERHGFVEECYFTFSYSAIREAGEIGGLFVTVVETTERIVRERREGLLKKLAAIPARGTPADICAQAYTLMGDAPQDAPFALFFSAEDEARWMHSCEATPEEVLRAVESRHRWVEASAKAQVGVHALPTPLVLAPWPEPLERLAVLPITPIGHARALVYLLLGLSPRLAFDGGYERFVQRIGTTLATVIAEAEAFESERRRAEFLAELDRAKTVFFSNVSHEFRTPLTLMLGPLQELVEHHPQLPAAAHAAVEMVQRNAMRLQRLVNSLLDFARIEAGRIEALYEPLDLSVFTTELADVFRSLIERAGLGFRVACEPLAEPVYVDREMWEKVVFNLLSNAFKFTLEGEIRVSLARRGRSVELRVEDTGAGIPEAELPKVFERFHRVQDIRARTHEGSGIGLALVKELVSLHGGKIGVRSRVGHGTCFSVQLPLGSAHLPADRVGAERTQASTALDGAVFVEEALGWLEDTAELAPRPPPATTANGGTHAARIVLADDNRDMRRYLTRLLSDHWEVEAAADGVQALAAVHRQRPDLVLTDVMMPNLDGFGLLRELRADADLRAVPVIMLSARSGEQAHVEGLRGGADDYLSKPFSARELIARIQAQLTRGHLLEVDSRLNRRLADVFYHAPVGLALLRGPHHVFDFVNPEYQAIVGGRELVGLSVREAFPEIGGQGFYDLLDTCYRSGEPYVGRSVSVSLYNEARELEEHFFDFSYQPTRAADGSISGIAVIAFEVTALAQAQQKAEQASRAKDEFFAMLGHELRNPLAPILTALHLMDMSGNDSFARERAIVERQARYLVRLIDDLLDVSRISRGDISLNVERLEVAAVVEMALETVRPLVDQYGHTLSVDLPPQRFLVDGDSVRLAQILSNLLTNAARYTPPGGDIQVAARRRGEQVQIEVSDNGVGIEPTQLTTIFDMFVRVQQQPAQGTGGLGLGLAIANSLAARHGGQLTAYSEGPGKGSRFVLSLPIATIETLSPAALALSAGEGVRTRGVGTGRPLTLIVDDNRDAADMLALALESLGYETRVVYDGTEALSTVQGLEPDVALLDLGLPGIDGHELARRLRQQPALARTFMVALTGYGQQRDRERSLAAGFDVHLVKPVDIQALDELIRQRVAGKTAGAVKGTREASSAARLS